MPTQLIELNDGLLVEVQSDPDDRPRQIVASAENRVDGAMDQAQELLRKEVQPIASVWDELNQDLTIEQSRSSLGSVSRPAVSCSSPRAPARPTSTLS